MNLLRDFTTLTDCQAAEPPDAAIGDRRRAALECLDEARAKAGAQGLCIHDWTMAAVEEAIAGFMVSGGTKRTATEAVAKMWDGLAETVKLHRGPGGHA